MIVDRHHAQHIDTGQVVEHRLPADLRPLQVGRRLSVLTLSGGHRCAVEITECHRAPSHEATLTSASLRALGHPRHDAYVRGWLIDRDTDWLARRVPRGESHPTTLNAALAAADHLGPEVLALRWRERWADAAVWVIHWRRTEQPLYLARIIGPQGDYTPDPTRAADPLEVVHTDDLDPGWVRAGRRRHDSARAGTTDRPPGVKAPHRRNAA